MAQGKRHLFIFIVSLILVLTLEQSLCFGSGFYIPEVGAKAMALGGAFTARADDLTAIYINPAGLSRVTGTTLLVEDGIMFLHSSFHRAGNFPAVKNAFTGGNIPFLGASSDFGLKDAVFALAAYGPYGAPEVSYPASGPQKYNVIRAKNEQVMYSLGGAWSLPWAPVRVGLALSRVDVFISYNFAYNLLGIDDPAFDAAVSADIKDQNRYTIGAGAQYSPLPFLEFGASYLPPIPIKARGPIRASIPENLSSVTGGITHTSDDLEVDITIPQIIRAGVRYLPTDRLDCVLDVVWMDWSRIKEYRLRFKNYTLTPPNSFGTVITDMSLPKNWMDTLSVRVGAEYKLLDALSIRGGYFFEQGAIPNNTLDASNPDSDKHGIGIGVGWTIGPVRVDAAYSHVFQPVRNVSGSITGFGGKSRANGEYRSSWDNLALGIAWKIL